MKVLILIGSGSFIGGVLRYLITLSVQKKMLSSFPYGTLMVNVLGCLLLGLLVSVFDRKIEFNSDIKLFLTIGLCGGFTTFSTFTLESFMLLKDSNYFHFFSYSLLSIIFCLLAFFLGFIAIKYI